MQPIIAGPRAALMEDAVKDLLQSHSDLQILYGADGLDADFNMEADVTQYMTEGSTITCDTTAKIHRTCQIFIDSAVISDWDYRRGFIRPWMKFVNPMTNYEAKFMQGVFTLPTPENDLSTLPSTIMFAGYDLMYLLNQPVGESYEVPAGVDPAYAASQAITTAVPGAFVDWTASTELTTTQLTWPFDGNDIATTWLEIVNKLLATIGYRSVWVDWDGVFRIEPYVDPQTVHPEWVFDLTSPVNIVGKKRTQMQDLYAVPNYWRFVMANQATSPVEGSTQFTYIDNSAINPGSARNRGRYYKHIETVNVTSFNALLQYGTRVVLDALKPSETIQTTVQPFPLLWHFDVAEYIDPNLAPVTLDATVNRRVVVTRFKLPLDGQSDMDVTFETVSDQFLELETTPSV